MNLIGVWGVNKLLKSAAAAAVSVAAMTTQASAQVSLWMIGATRHGQGHPAHQDGRFGRHHGHGSHGNGQHYGHGGGGSSGGGVPSAPEIDVSQAAAAIVIVLVAFLLIREIYLRQRQPV